MTEKGKALWSLALLSPIIAELMSGSSPPLEFFNPFSFALLLGLYGAGALVVRELVVMWDKGWASVLCLGVAYGILEEGVAIKSFFDPEWMDLGGLGEYGRYLGTNFVWAVWLTIYHAMISISLPILLVSILFPRLRRERFLEGRKFTMVLVILFLDVLVCTTLLNDYVPFPPMYVLSIAAVFAFAYLAKVIPKDLLSPLHQGPSWSLWKFSALGFAFFALCFLIVGVFVDTSVLPIVPVVIMLMMASISVLLIVQHIGRTENLSAKVYLACGLLGFFVPLGIILELNGMLGMSLVALVTAMFIVDLTRWSRGKRSIMFRFKVTA